MEKRKDPWIQLHIADYRHIRAYCKAHKLRSAASIIDILLAYRSLWRGPGTNERDLRLTREGCRDLGLDKSTLARGTRHLVLMGYLDVVRLGRTKNGFRCSVYGLPDATIQGRPVHPDLRPTVSSIATDSTTDGERSHLSPRTVSSTATERPVTVSSIASERSHLPPPLVPPERSGGGTSSVPPERSGEAGPLRSADAPLRGPREIEEIGIVGETEIESTAFDESQVPGTLQMNLSPIGASVVGVTPASSGVSATFRSDPTPLVSSGHTSSSISPAFPRSPGVPKIEDFTLEDFFGDFPMYCGVSTIEETTFRNKEVLMKMYNSKVQKYATGTIKKDKSAPPLSRCSPRFQEYYRAHKSEYKEVARGN